MLSATPMYDKYEELDFIINLLLLNDKKKSTLKRTLINNYVNNLDEDSKSEIIEKTTGYISYIKGNDPHIFPLILYPENNSKIIYKNTPNGDITSEKINAVICNMSTLQQKIYSQTNKINEKRKYSNVVFPENKKFDSLFTYNSKSKKYAFNKDNADLCIDFLSNIDKYSTKIKALLDNLENSNGKVFIYSEYKKGDYAGTFLLAIILEYYGYFRKTINKEKNGLIINSYLDNNNIIDKKKYYIMVDGSTPQDDFTFYKNIFNIDNNIKKNIIKIIIGTTNMIEGVSLNNVRQIHIMQPWYNISRNDQIVGRGVRQCSHIKLPFNQRNITIFNYVAVSKEFTKVENNYIVPYNSDTQKQDIDLRKLYLATEKIKKITLLEDLLKTNSIDCLLNENINNIEVKNIKIKNVDDVNEKDSVIEHIDSFGNKQLISYVKTDNIKCNNIEDKPITTNNIYNYQLKTFMNKNLKKNTKYFIKKIFTLGILRKKESNTIITYQTNKVYFSYNELFEQLQLYNSEIDENLFKISLQDLILNKEIFYNKFNKPGYIIFKGMYLIFKWSNFENINLPLEFSMYPFNNKINVIDNYVYYSVTTNLKPKTTKSTPKLTPTNKTVTQLIKQVTQIIKQMIQLIKQVIQLLVKIQLI